VHDRAQRGWTDSGKIPAVQKKTRIASQPIFGVSPPCDRVHLHAQVASDVSGQAARRERSPDGMDTLGGVASTHRPERTDADYIGFRVARASS